MIISVKRACVARFCGEPEELRDKLATPRQTRVAQMAEPLDSWTIERLEAFAAAQYGEELEQVRVIAESHVHWSDEPDPTRTDAPPG